MFEESFKVNFESWNNAGTNYYTELGVYNIRGENYFDGMISEMCQKEDIIVASINASKLISGEIVEGGFYSESDTTPVVMLALYKIENHKLLTYDKTIKDEELIDGIYEGKTINTPSMICVEDALDGLNWAEKNGGLNFLLDTSMNSFNLIYNWVQKNDWVTFLSENKNTEYLSNTGITFKICENWYLSKSEDDQRLIVKEICKLLSDENVAFDINGYAKAPPSFRVWAGGTVETNNIKLLLPWLEWAYFFVKERIESVMHSLNMKTIELIFIGRRSSASPATGVQARHTQNQKNIIDLAIKADKEEIYDNKDGVSLLKYELPIE